VPSTIACNEATNAADGLAHASRHPPDVILLDLGLPDGDGVDVIRQIRQWQMTVPIIVLSVRSQERDKVIALDAGADDFVGKPFAVGELLARLRVALRRSASNNIGDALPANFRAGDLEVDFTRRRVLLGGKEVHLTRIEYKLLQVMVQHADRVLTHAQLRKAVWGPQHEEQAHYVRFYMGQLRRKLEPDPARPRYIRTEPGIGYRLTTE
jgi:two-component system KDP operon response regulator KdpE